MEYIDIFDENNNPIGEIKEKQQAKLLLIMQLILLNKKQMKSHYLMMKMVSQYF